MTEQKKETKAFELKQIVTQTQPVVFDNVNEAQLTLEEAIVAILNKLETIDKKL